MKRYEINLTRGCDVFFSVIGLIITLPILILIFILGLFDTGSPLFYQKRVGRNQKAFTLIKFRTMQLNTAQQATHLTSQSSVTKFGSFLRKTKLDELPQLVNVIKGDMSIVGPRPCLITQLELIQKREELGVFSVRPGVTGLAQINQIDMSEPKLLASVDAKMIEDYSLFKYLKIIFMTLLGRGLGDKIR